MIFCIIIWMANRVFFIDLPCIAGYINTAGCMRKPYCYPPYLYCSVCTEMLWRSLGASEHKSPLFHSLEHCLVSWRLEKRSAVVAVPFSSDSLLCADGAQMLRIPAELRGFYPASLGPVLALLLELHIIEVFVLCGRLCWDTSMLSKGQRWFHL